MKILHLTLKKKWFDMILSGKKKEEYREIKGYWIKRLIRIRSEIEYQVWQEFIYSMVNNHYGLNSYEECLDYFNSELACFDAVKLTNGYAKNAPSFLIEFKGIEIGTAKPEWSDNWQGDVFIIKLGGIILP